MGAWDGGILPLDAFIDPASWSRSGLKAVSRDSTSRGSSGTYPFFSKIGSEDWRLCSDNMTRCGFDSGSRRTPKVRGARHGEVSSVRL